MTTLLGLKIAVFAGLFAWWLARDRVDYRPVLSPPRWRSLTPIAMLLLAAVAAGMSEFVAAITLAVAGLVDLCSYPLGEWKLSPVGIESGRRRTMRWDDVSSISLRRGGVELRGHDGSRLLLPRDLDGMVTFSRIAQMALPAAVLQRPQVQWLLADLERGGDVRERRCLAGRRGERGPLLI